MRYLALLLILGSYFGPASLAGASSFYEQPFPETVRSASSIVRGRIGKSEARWTTLSDGSKHLFTYYDVQVAEGLKGVAPAGPIRIRELGGEKDGVSLQVSGTARFAPGEDVVVMLGEPSSSGDGAFPVAGMMMGKYDVEKGADGKEYLSGPGLSGSLHPELRQGNAASDSTQISLDGLREIIRVQAEHRQAAPAPKSPNPSSNEGLLASKAGHSSPAFSDTSEVLQTVEAPKSGRLAPSVILFVGAVIGGLLFLKSRRKKR